MQSENFKLYHLYKSGEILLSKLVVLLFRPILNPVLDLKKKWEFSCNLLSCWIDTKMVRELSTKTIKYSTYVYWNRLAMFGNQISSFGRKRVFTIGLLTSRCTTKFNFFERSFTNRLAVDSPRLETHFCLDAEIVWVIEWKIH